MISKKEYIIIIILSVILFTLIVGLVIIDSRVKDAQNDILVKNEVVADTIPEETMTAVLLSNVEKNTYTEPPVKETEPVTEPPMVEETEPTEEPTEPEPTEPEIVIDPEELEMLACVIYQEAGGNGSCDECRYRVGDVVLNRVADSRFPDTMYKVLTAKAQYGRFHWTGIVWPSRANNSGEAEAVERAYEVAKNLLTGHHSELYGKGYIWQAEFVQGKDNVYCCGHYFGR